MPAPAIVAGEIEDQLGERRVASVAGARNPVGTEGGFSIRVVATVYDGGRETGTTTLRWTYNGLD